MIGRFPGALHGSLIVGMSRGMVQMFDRVLGGTDFESLR